jgi:hypothetical protein
MKYHAILGLIRISNVALLSAAALLLAALPASAAPTLAGENLHSPFDYLSVNGTCNTTGPSTFSFTANGPATGPFTGHFHKAGSFTLASPGGPISSFAANFTIYPVGQPNVTGTESLGSSTTASCAKSGYYSYVQFTASMNYSVTAPFTEMGTVAMSLGFTNLVDTQNEGPFTPKPTTPKTKQDCMNGGFQNFVDPSTGSTFKNQGQCIKFVTHA